ncbi:EH signature domain-containing protein [Bartonella sp. HY761]|uniref:EH signature domain-containing protein n=1 Tax=Bartonella sp. HY761 TaxID=2979330 RepID=UPI002202C8F7|nr:EH signature domain-containing protein [Bartonella sp. HY761]UXN05422.1 EH signature domain-containing protein [Bartonella sp. HY761]
MTSLLDSLRLVYAPLQVAIAENPASIKAVKRVFDQWPNMDLKPMIRDPEALIAKMRGHVQNNYWQGVKTSFVTSTAWALFDKERIDRPDLQSLREFYYREVEATRSPSFLSTLFKIYLDSFNSAANHTMRLAAALAKAKPYLKGYAQGIVSHLSNVLNPMQIVEDLANLMVASDNPWQELRNLGFASPHAPGLLNAAHLLFIRKIAPNLSQKPQMEKLVKWLRPDGAQAKNNGAAEAIEALLTPWLDKSPSDEIKDYLTQSLTGIYGDPRIHTGNNWKLVSENHKKLLLRWLTGANIRLFLDVVTKVEASHMWEPRRKFWLGLDQKQRIDEAWVAFSDDAAKYARRLAQLGQKGLQFGHQTAGSHRRDTSLLIMRIGKKIIIEGSHSYKIYIFDESEQRAPKLYQSRYDCEEIRLIDPDRGIMHNGNWQNKVELKI